MKMTGERFVPGKMFKYSEIEHMHRYSILKKVLNDKIVLDAACGTGYGTDMIAVVAKRAYGIDVSDEAIQYASENFKRDNLQYKKGDITSIPFEDKKFDVVVSFETIEHVDGRMQIEFLKEIKRVLKPDGILIMSTPNKDIYTIKAGNVATEWHVKEFFEEEFDLFIRSEFSNVLYYQQYISRASYLLDGENEKVCIAAEDKGKKGKFIVAVASNRQLDNEMNLNSIYYYPDEFAALDEICQVFWGDATGEFQENNSELVEVNSKSGEIKISLDVEGGVKTKRVRVDPLNNTCKLSGFKVVITTKNGEQISEYKCNVNADKVVEDMFYFYHRDPQYVFEFENEEEICKIDICFCVVEYNINAYEYLTEKIAWYEELLNTERDCFKREQAVYQNQQGKYEEVLTAIEREKSELAIEKQKLLETAEKERSEHAVEKQKLLEAAEQERIRCVKACDEFLKQLKMLQEDLFSKERAYLEEKAEYEKERTSFYNRTVMRRIKDVFVKPREYKI